MDDVNAGLTLRQRCADRRKAAIMIFDEVVAAVMLPRGMASRQLSGKSFVIQLESENLGSSSDDVHLTLRRLKPQAAKSLFGIGCGFLVTGGPKPTTLFDRARSEAPRAERLGSPRGSSAGNGQRWLKQ